MMELNMGKLADLAKPKFNGDLVETSVLEVSRHIESMAQYLHEEYVSMARTRNVDFNVDSAEFTKYLLTLIVLRVQYVRGEDRGMYNRLKLEVFHPHIINSILSTIGKGYVEQYSLTIIPKTMKLTEDHLSEGELIEMGRKLWTFKKNSGVSMAEQLPLDKSGDALVMSFQIIEDDIKAADISRSHTQALIALLAGISLPSMYLTPRITYISKDSVASLVRNVTRFEFP